MRLFLVLALTFAVPQWASAADWRYCLAPSHTEHKVYMTPPFAASIALDDAESELAHTLSQSGLRYDDVQCPRSDDESSVLDMQQHAVSVNRQLGNQIINLHWKPGS
jgi:hypothetical protein